MLLITPKASEVIRELLARPTAPASSGLRIHRGRDGAGELTVSPVAVPEQGDQIIEDEGMRLFLGPNAAIILADQQLEADVETGGRVRFHVTPQT